MTHHSTGAHSAVLHEMTASSNYPGVRQPCSLCCVLIRGAYCAQLKKQGCSIHCKDNLGRGKFPFQFGKDTVYMDKLCVVLDKLLQILLLAYYLPEHKCVAASNSSFCTDVQIICCRTQWTYSNTATLLFLVLYIWRSISFLHQSTQFPAIPCIIVSCWDVWGDFKERDLPQQIHFPLGLAWALANIRQNPPSAVPQDTGLTDERKYIQYLFCQFNVSAGGLPYTLQQSTMGRLTLSQNSILTAKAQGWAV